MNCNEVQRGLSVPQRFSVCSWEAPLLSKRHWHRAVSPPGPLQLSSEFSGALAPGLSLLLLWLHYQLHCHQLRHSHRMCPRRGTLSQSLRGSQCLCERNPPKGKAGKISHKQLTGVFWKLVFKRPPFPSHSICSLTLPFTPGISCSCSLPQNFSKRKRHSYFLLRKSRKLVWTRGWLRQPREGKLINCCIT